MDEDKAHYVVVTGIVIKDGKYLITKRSMDEKAFPGLWTVPGGKLEIREYKDKPKDTSSHWYNVLESLLRREVKEETGLEIKNIKYLTSLTFIRSDGVPTIIISLFADHHNGEVVLNGESIDHAWVSLVEAKNYELIEGIYEELEMLDNFLNSGEGIGEWSKKQEKRQEEKSEGMKIAIDLDDVIADFTRAFLEFCNLQFNKNLKFEDWKRYHFSEVFGGTEEDELEVVKEFFRSGWTEKFDFIDGAKKAIEELSGENELIIITSRLEEFREKTKEFLTQHFSDISFKIIHSKNPKEEPGKTKADFCKALGVGVIIEDHDKYALECAEKGIKVLMLDKPWNRNCKEHENIIRVRDWNEILEKINGRDKIIVKKIRKFVEEECKKPTNNHEEAYKTHFIPVVEYSKILAGKLNADIEIVELAAWLHDIGSVIHGRVNHHITSSEIAEKKLSEFGYDKGKIEKIKHCILAHRGSQDIERRCIEAEILAEADAMSHFDDLPGLFKAAFVYEGLKRDEAKESLKNHLINSFNKLSSGSKEIIKPKYAAAMLLLK